MANAAQGTLKMRDQSERDERGRFRPGHSVKSPGRPPAEFSFTEVLRTKVMDRPKLIDRLLDLAESEDENVSLKAILGIANRIDGMPKQSHEVEHKGDPPAVAALKGIQQTLEAKAKTNGHGG